jgi:transcriptional regulator with XRE-family HTH domain
MSVTSAQIRMARAALDWTVRDLAEAAGLHRNTITNIERGRGGDKKTLAAIEATLSTAGVEFIDENGGGAGVRLRKPHRIAPEDRFARRLGERNKIITHDEFLIKKNLAITAEQLRAARGLLGWSQSELAARAGLSLPTVRRVESETGPRVSDEARARLKKALESAGVSFIDENGGGLGVRLRERRTTRK